MPITIGKFIFNLEGMTWLMWLIIIYTFFHIAMLLKALFRRNWGWMVLMFLFPLVDIIYFFKK